MCYILGLQIEQRNINPSNKSWSNVVQFSDVKPSSSEQCVLTMKKANANPIKCNALPNYSNYALSTKAKMKESKVDDSATMKKVKKKDPITLDLFQAIQVRK